jgi:hypothetical protein
MKSAARQQQFLKPPWVWEKSGQDPSPPSALNHKAVRTLEKAPSNDLIEKAPLSVHPFLSHLFQGPLAIS